MDIMDILFGGLLGFALVAMLPNNITSWRPTLKRSKNPIKKV
jgi:hypothetical protein